MTDKRHSGSQTSRGALWAALYRPSFLVVDTARNIVLARLLLPREHGLFGVAVVAARRAGGRDRRRPGVAQRLGLWASALTDAVVMTMMSFLVLPWLPSFKLDLEKARELFRFGRWVLAEGILRVLFHQADDLVVARMLGATALGHYRRSYGWANLPAYQVVGMITVVGLPIFARRQDRPAELLESLRQALRWVSLFAFPSLLVIVTLAPRLVGPVLGEPWIPMIPALQVLAVWGFLRSLSTPLVSVLQALNRPEVTVRASLVKLVLFAALIVPLTSHWGLIGTSVTVVAATAVEVPILFRQTLWLIDVPGAFRKLLRDPAILAGCAALMGGAMAATLHAVGPTPELAPSLAAAAAAGVVGVAVLALATRVADRFLGLGIWDMVRRQIIHESP